MFHIMNVKKNNYCSGNLLNISATPTDDGSRVRFLVVHRSALAMNNAAQFSESGLPFSSMCHYRFFFCFRHVSKCLRGASLKSYQIFLDKPA